jgi:transposase
MVCPQEVTKTDPWANRKDERTPKVTSKVDRNIHEWFLRQAYAVVRHLPSPWEPRRRGRMPHDPRVIVLACLFKEAFGLNFDETESLLKSHEKFLKEEPFGIERGVPTRSPIHRGYQRLSKRYMKRLNKKLTCRFRRRGMVLIVDSTGFRLKTSSHWYDIRIKRRNRRRDCMKLHLVVLPNGVILNYTLTNWNRHDSPQLKRLLSVFKTVAKVLGDKGYLSRENCTLVTKKNGVPVFALKKNTTAKAKGSPAWRRMVRFATNDAEGFKSVYHIRSVVESVFSSMKKRMGSVLSAMKAHTRRVQLTLRIIAHNVRIVLYDKTAKALGGPAVR